MAIAVAALVLAFALGHLVTPLVRRWAVSHDYVDRPDGQRKIQPLPVALGGGLTLLFVTPLVVLLLVWWWGPDLFLMTLRPMSVFGLAAAAVLLAVVGVVDDTYGMGGKYKLFWQMVAISLVMGAGLSVPRLAFLGVEVSLGLLGSLFTVAWLLGAINSFNLIDGIDGLAGSVGVVFSLTFGCIALLGGQYLDSIIAFSLAGSLLGFLRYNLPPATIYLGDTGSMFIGLVLGSIALRCSMKQAATLAFAAPLAIWSIPMLDAAAAVIRRKLTGRSLYATDRGHIHHVLLTRGMSAGQAVSLITALCAITSVGAVASWYWSVEWLGVAVVLGVIGTLVFTRLFGHVEFLLLNTRLFGFGRLFTRYLGEQPDSVRESSLNLQGTRRWEELWGALVESAGRFNLIEMQLNLSLPSLHEEFYATWSRAGSHQRELLWKTGIPLVVQGSSIGRLSVAGCQNADSTSSEMRQFIVFVETLETQLAELIREDLDPRLDGVNGSEASAVPADDPLLGQVPATLR